MSSTKPMNQNAVISVSDGGSSKSILVGNKPILGAGKSKPVRVESGQSDLAYVPWGSDNQEPQRLVRDLKSNATLRSALDWMVRALYNGGLEYGYAELDENGEKKFKVQSIPEIDYLLKCSNYQRQADRGFYDAKTTGNLFPEIILTKDRKKVALVNFNQSPYCRLSVADNKGFSRFCYVSANWDLVQGELDPKGIKVPMLDNSFDELLALQEGKYFKYVLADANYPTIGNSYYAEPVWNPLRISGWLEYANQIPTFKKSYLKNASHIKYVVHVPESWWQWKYPDWDTLEAEEKQTLVRENHDRFNQFLTGIENAGKSLMLTFRDDPGMKQEGYTQWKIELVDKKIVDQILGGDLLDITQMIYQSLGVHATLLGGAPGASNLGAGSGSDQREAYNIFMALSTFDQDLIARPFELAAHYNGYPNLKFRFNSRLIANLSDVTPSKRTEQNAN